MTDFDSIINVNKKAEDIPKAKEQEERKPQPPQSPYSKDKKKPIKNILDEEIAFTEEDKRKIEHRFNKRFKPGTREKRILKKREHKQYQFKQQFIIMMAAIGIFFILALYAYAPGDDVVMVLILLIGCLLCIPIGMVFGWVLIDPFMRCKLLRKTTKRNYGIVNFVGKGRKMVTRIKNFDNDLIWIKNKCWVITSQGIHELDKYGDSIIEGQQIMPENIVAVTETVPVLFIDLDSMEPLILGKEGREKIMPEELGSTLKGWIDNQMAKISFLKKTMDIYFIVVILSALAAAALSFMIYQEVMELTEEIDSISNSITQIITMLGP
jgi:hypothetical protein